MKRFVAIAIATMVLAPITAVPASADWSAPGSGVTAGGGTLSGGSPAPVVGPKVSSGTVGAGGKAPSTRGKFIEISLAKQRMTAWQDGRVVMHFKISTGKKGFRTPSGRFKVRAKGVRWWSRKWKVWMPYAMNFYSNYNLHSLPHAKGSSKLIGANTLGMPVSHGCVRIGPADAKRLYAWTPVGTPVWIH